VRESPALEAGILCNAAILCSTRLFIHGGGSDSHNIQPDKKPGLGRCQSGRRFNTTQSYGNHWLYLIFVSLR
jgi:hypothetical protein